MSCSDSTEIVFNPSKLLVLRDVTGPTVVPSVTKKTVVTSKTPSAKFLVDTLSVPASSQTDSLVLIEPQLSILCVPRYRPIVGAEDETEPIACAVKSLTLSSISEIRFNPFNS